jgi:hypothetical protein
MPNFTGKNQVVFADDGHVDAFGRLRVSEPETLFDSKQLVGKLPLFWDEATSGGSETSTHSTVNASTTMTVTANGEYVIRQTKMRFNYQPGKSQQVFLTFVLGTGVASVEKKVGYFNSSTSGPYTANVDGLYLKQDGTTVSVCQSKNGTETAVAQSDWNINKMDGTGPFPFTVDWSKAQILIIDFEWLGTGRVRFGLVLAGSIVYVHEFKNANNLDSVYMSSPNHSCRYEIRSTGGTDSLEQICSSVASEGGSESLGILHSASTAGTHIDADVENTLYAIIGIRLKSTELSTSVRLVSGSIQCQTASELLEWNLLWNPTVAGVFTFNGITNSSVEYATGATANTVTGGTLLAAGFFQSTSGGGGSGSTDLQAENALRLGAAIDGTVDELVLAVRPVGGTTGADIEAALGWRELV